jgi:hypothetical protein
MRLSPQEDRSGNELLVDSLNEERRTLGASQLAMCLVDMLEDYLRSNPEATIDGACQLLDTIPTECKWAETSFDMALASRSDAPDIELPRSTICKTLQALQVRFGTHFTREGGLKALDDLSRWSIAIKADLLKDTGRE